MKKLLALAAAAAALALPSALHAQSFSINWHAIAGGGGSSSGTNGGTVYVVSGTIGQPATAIMSGGGFSITGGFWSFLSVVQTAGSPLLTITRSGTQAIVSWPYPSAGFVLQQSSNLLLNSWSASGATLTTNGATVSATVPANSGYQFFRLVNP